MILKILLSNIEMTGFEKGITNEKNDFNIFPEKKAE